MSALWNSLVGVPRQIVSDNLKAGITKACSTSRRLTGPMLIFPSH